VRSGSGAARTILLFHIISDRPSKQPLMVPTFLKVYMELGSYFLFLQEQIKDIIITHSSLTAHPPALKTLVFIKPLVLPSSHPSTYPPIPPQPTFNPSVCPGDDC
jgi:hypothetical protein